ncbi:MAG: M48 family metalloprotease [Acidobacteria bacterium]|nr:M48 family metalloprotease [Acidobacteriota bacterium]MCA1652397.1 M48 family metalloprotease [Acidobacteriota bacterium]
MGPWFRHIRSALLLSRSVLTRLTSSELVALLAHEAAHLRRRHPERALGWSFFGAVVVVGSASHLAQFALVRPRAGSFTVWTLSLILSAAVVKRLFDRAISRRSEAEADRYAIEIAGAGALFECAEK